MANDVQKRFDNPSKLFMWLFDLGNFFRSGSYYKELLKAMNLKGNESILEFGSGVGSLAKRLAPAVQNQGRLTCVDVSEKLLVYTKGKLKKYSNVNYYHGDIRNSSIPDNSFDIIVSTWVLHHVERSLLQDTINKLYSLIKAQGKIFIIEFSDKKYNHTKMTELELIEYFKNANFSYRIIFTKKQGILYEFSKN